MKVLFIQGSMNAGGISKCNDVLANEFNRLGHTVEFLSYMNDPSYRSHSFKFGKISAKCLLFMPFLLFCFFRKNKYDLVISSSDLISFPVCIISKLFSFKLIVNSHTNVIKHLESKSSIYKLVYKLGGLTYRLSDAVGNVSVGASLASKEFFNLREVHYLPNGVTAWKGNEGEIEHKWFKSDVRLIIACGRLVSGKNYEAMIEAFALTFKKVKDIRLIILGDGPERDKLKHLTSTLSLSKYIDFIGEVDEPRIFMQHAEFLLHTSFYEGAPLVLLEALSTGVPIVTTNFKSGASEILDGGIYGEISDSFQAEDISRAMLKQFDLTKRNSLFYINRASEYNERNSANNYLRIYNEKNK
ncbi:MAG: glycosyltransferase involved in cell wall biosynthesis [Oleiphilaceae bacterium]